MAGTANAVNGPEAAPYLAKAGGVMTGALTLNSSSPASDLIAASKGYVDSVAQGRVYKDPCEAATTGALTATYDNGSSGVGATLTNAGAMAAFQVDGYSAAVSDPILIKDQAATEQNGIYTVTTVGSGAVNWVLTRSTDMDLAAEFKSATTFIINGTTNAGRTYTETATVTTIGTDPVTFSLTGDATAVTSVATAGLATGGPITSTGTITVTAATQSDQETGTSTAVAVVPGVQQYHASASKCWVYATVAAGVATAEASYNVASMANNGTGNYSATIATDFSSDNYSVVGNVNTAGSYALYVTFQSTAGSMTLYSATGTIAIPVQADFDFSMQAFGDQA